PLAVGADPRGTAPGPGRQRAGGAPLDSDGGEDRRRLARLSRTRSRRRRPRRADRDRLVGGPAGGAVAPAHRTRVGVVCGAAPAPTPRGGGATRRSSPAPTWPPANRSGGTTTRPGSGSRTPGPARARRRPSTTVACTPAARPAS